MNDELTQLLTPVLQEQGLEIDELKVVRAGKNRVVRLDVDGDGPQGHGPDLDQISDATRAISALLDESDVMGEHPYTLEVSSRGATKPLTKPVHFRRNAGRLVLFTLGEGNATGKPELLGRILSADDSVVVVAPEVKPAKKGAKPKKPDVDQLSVPYEDIEKAVVQLELNREG